MLTTSVDRQDAPALTDRQQAVLVLVEQYYAAAHEMPSAGWLSRRLLISRKRAWQHVQALRDKGRWIDARR